MSFVSVAFWIFFPLVLLSQRLLRAPRARQCALLIASYVFYGWWDWRFCALMLLMTAAAYLSARAIERHPGRRRPLIAGLAVPLGALFVFKYLGFFVDTFCAAFGLKTGALRLILPVGISFYTFQSMSYTIDVWRGRLKASRDPLKFALYIAFFPQLVAGPIVRASDFLPQLDEDRRPCADGVFRGLTEFAFGLLKKAVLADNLSVFVDAVFASVGGYASGTVALAVLAYALQIYFDFSGYSDMAAGAARCLGYDLPENFRLPYLSRSVGAFWRRWHISLSNWMRDYVYIPLGGNRKGRARTLINLTLTMVLCGLWHGASWTFVAWGALHGAALCAQRLWSARFPARPGALRTLIATALTDLFVALTWVLFRSETFAQAAAVCRRLFAGAPGVRQTPVWLIAALTCSAGFALWKGIRRARTGAEMDGAAPMLKRGSYFGTLALLLMFGFALVLMYTGDNPFIYFQF